MDPATADGPDGDEHAQQQQAQTNERETQQSDAEQQHEQATGGAAADIDLEGHLVHEAQRRPTTAHRRSTRVELYDVWDEWG
jgi:hypothetical protein